MRKVILAVVVVALAAISLPPPVTAQAATQEASLADRGAVMARLLDAGLQIQAAMGSLFSGQFIEPDASARTWQETLRTRRPDIDQALAVIRQASSEIQNLRASGNELPDRQINNFVDTLSEQASTAEGMVLALIEVSAALEAGDQTAIERGVQTLVQGTIVIMDGQALAVRAQGAMFPSGQSQQYFAYASAALMEGTAFKVKANNGIVSQIQARNEIQSRAESIAENAREGSAALEREINAGTTDAEQAALIDSLVGLKRESFAIVLEGEALLHRAAAEVENGEDTDAWWADYDALSVRMNQNTSEQMRIIAGN